jgi:hypothetical protein
VSLVDFLKKVGFLFLGIVNINLHVTSAMFKWTETELALLKGIEIQGHPLMAEACQN